MGFINVPPALSDGSSQLVGQKQSQYSHQGIRREKNKMAVRTWVGHLWRGLTAQEEEREEAYPEKHQEGLGFPTTASQ